VDSHPSSVVDPRVEELINRWKAARQQGAPLSPEELCRDCPELLAPLRERIASEQSQEIDKLGSQGPYCLVQRGHPSNAASTTIRRARAGSLADRARL
jgi:hypothetical protein